MSKEQRIIREIPRLRRYAHSLCLNRDDGDDLVQATLDRALSRISYWKTGTNIRAWLMTIMHNIYVNNVRSHYRAQSVFSTTNDVLGEHRGEQDRKGLILRDLERGLARLSFEHRQALLLVAMEEYSYKEAAKIADVTVGTLASRLHRARSELQQYMEGENVMPLRRVK